MRKIWVDDVAEDHADVVYTIGRHSNRRSFQAMIIVQITAAKKSSGNRLYVHTKANISGSSHTYFRWHKR